MARSVRRTPVFAVCSIRKNKNRGGKRGPRKQWKQEESRRERREVQTLLTRGDDDSLALAASTRKRWDYKDPSDGWRYMREQDWGYTYPTGFRGREKHERPLIWIEVPPEWHKQRAMRK